MKIGVLAAMTAFSVFGFIIFAGSFTVGIQSLSWPSVQGQVIDSNYGFQGIHDSGWDLGVEYKYFVGSKMYRSNKVFAASNKRFTYEQMHATVDKIFKPGALLPVYFNPRNAAQSVLFPGVGAQDCLILFCIIVWNIAMFCQWYLRLSGKLKDAESAKDVLLEKMAKPQEKEKI